MAEKKKGAQRAAIVLIGLGDEMAAEILKKLPKNDQQSILQAMGGLKGVSSDEIAAALQSFHELIRKQHTSAQINPIAFARRILEKSHDQGEAKKLEVAMGLDVPRFEWLSEVEPRILAEVMLQEIPRTAALILAHASPEFSSKVLGMLPRAIQTEILICLVKIEAVQVEVLKDLEEELRNKLYHLKMAATRRIGGIGAASAALAQMGAAARQQQLDEIASRDPELAENLRRAMFAFENLIKVKPQGIQLLLRIHPTPVWCLALRGAGKDLVEYLLSNMSARNAKAFKEELDASGPKAKKAVEEAQEKIMFDARRLLDEGKLALDDDSRDAV